MSIAKKIKDLPFYTALRGAEQLRDNVEHYLNGSIYTFSDGSRLGFYFKTNSLDVLSELLSKD